LIGRRANNGRCTNIIERCAHKRSTFQILSCPAFSVARQTSFWRHLLYTTLRPTSQYAHRPPAETSIRSAARPSPFAKNQSRTSTTRPTLLASIRHILYYARRPHASETVPADHHVVAVLLATTTVPPRWSLHALTTISVLITHAISLRIVSRYSTCVCIVYAKYARATKITNTRAHDGSFNWLTFPKR